MTSSSFVTVLVLSPDLALRAVACTIVERSGLPAHPAATGDEAVRLVRELDGPTIILVDRVTPDVELADLHAGLGERDELPAPAIALLPSDASVDLPATIQQLVGDGLRQLAEHLDLAPDGAEERDPFAEVVPQDIPTMESAVVWETIPIEDAKHGDFVSWTPVLGASAYTGFIVAIRPLRLGSMAGWIVETSGPVTWLPCGARVKRARAGDR